MKVMLTPRASRQARRAELHTAKAKSAQSRFCVERMMSALHRIARFTDPLSAPGVRRIRVTGGKWGRLRSAQYRIIVSVEKADHDDVLLVRAVYIRDDSTYTLVETLFKGSTRWTKK